MGDKGHAAWTRLWSEAPHVDAYLSIVDEERQRRPARGAGKAPA
jgi:hypothetical protein